MKGDWRYQYWLGEAHGALGELLKWSGAWGMEEGVAEIWAVASPQFKEAVRKARTIYERQQQALEEQFNDQPASKRVS